ncbi:hypothetical protein [Aureimonas sp. SK2]|uniref:hypothetical protein n=1 Tax=Aureimonas sp. SK2 TaxID=3015992 RepID=UPI0024437FA1|nr:hypothetical protein [Aureimonas sp. SK2]
MREHFVEWVIAALKAYDGEATIVEVCRHIWEHHEGQLREAGDHFFTWQYDVRWAANQLARKGFLEYGRRGRNNLWILKGK